MTWELRIMVALSNKYSLKKTGFELEDEGIKYRHRYYRFDDVVEIKAVRHTLEKKFVGLGSDFHCSIAIAIYVQSGEELRVTEKQTLLSNANINIVQIIENQFTIISEKTRLNRLNKYVEQVENAGYYEYSGWNFYPQQQLIKNVKRDKSYNIDSVVLSRKPLYIEVKMRNTGAGLEMIKNLGAKIEAIDTLTDTDIFFILLDHFFNIKL